MDPILLNLGKDRSFLMKNKIFFLEIFGATKDTLGNI